MEEIKNSKLLDYVISRVKDIMPAASLTAPRFLFVVLDLLYGKMDPMVSAEEKKKLEEVLKSCMPPAEPGYAGIRLFLADKVLDEDFKSRVDMFSFQKKMLLAKQAAREAGQTELSVSGVLEQVFRDPDRVVIECIMRSMKMASPKSGEVEKKDPPPAAPEDPVPFDIPPFLSPTGTRPPAAEPPEPELTEDDPEYHAKKIRERKSALSKLVDQVKDMSEKLSDTVLGQENAIDVFTEGYYRAELQAITGKKQPKPRATFLFAGPPGVGKTFLAESVAAMLKLPYKRFDMSEYSDKEAPLEFSGSDKVYKDGKQGNVTGFVAKNPKCILLFDEIEKAHLHVIHLFLQILDAGRLRDSYTDKEVPFEDAILIFTTNAGRKLYEDTEYMNFASVSRKVILKALQQDKDPDTNNPFFPPAICSRFASGNVVMFNHITANNLRNIAKREIGNRAEIFEDKLGIRFSFDERVYSAILFAEGGFVDARTVKSRSGQFFENEMYELFRLIAAQRVKSSVEDVEEINFRVELPKDRPEVRKLFEQDAAAEILLIGSQKTEEACRAACEGVEFCRAQNAEEVKEVLKRKSPSFVLLDVGFQLSGDSGYLNIEDAESTARELFWLIHENYGALPIYLLQTDGVDLNREERTSFRRLGVRGVFQLEKREELAASVREAAVCLYQQRSMEELASANKLISFETAQTISDDGKIAEIKLFDLELETAVEAGDEKKVMSSVSKPDVRFDQVIGAEDAKRELEYFVDYLSDPKKYIGTGVSAPKGVLLYGPPGTGKTMLAKATAAEANVTFLAAEGNDFLKKYVGEGPDLVHEMFRTARKYAPAILFIDEIDAIARNRDSEMAQHSADILTAFLAEMDGFKTDLAHPVFVLAATNCDVSPGAAELDPALLRRFDRRIFVDVPKRDGRLEYIRMRMAECRTLQISEEQAQNIATRSTGMSLAELSSVIELALRTAIRGGYKQVTDKIFDEAFETFNNGETKVWDKDELERTARHEAGHAFVCWYGGETPAYLTIVARAGHGGYMQHGDKEGKGIYTKAELLAKLRTSLGGRAAEIVYYGEEEGLSTGPSSDLRNATATARRILCTYGMDRSFGLSSIDQGTQLGGELSGAVMKAINELLETEMQNAIRIISDNREAIDALVEQLLLKNQLLGPEIDAILQAKCPR